MTTALEGGEWSAARPGRTLPPGKTRYPFYRGLGGPQGRSGRTENLVPTGIRSRTVQPVVSRYTDWATRHITPWSSVRIFILHWVRLLFWRRWNETCEFPYVCLAFQQMRANWTVKGISVISFFFLKYENERGFRTEETVSTFYSVKAWTLRANMAASRQPPALSSLCGQYRRCPLC